MCKGLQETALKHGLRDNEGGHVARDCGTDSTRVDSERKQTRAGTQEYVTILQLERPTAPTTASATTQCHDDSE